MPWTHGRLDHHPNAAPHDLVAAPDPSGGDFGLGAFYLWRGCLPKAEAACYFSRATYATAGHGDVVLAKPRRLLGPIESLMGILMCGLSAGYFFVVVSHIHQSRPVKATAVSTTERTQP